ncbi:MAG: PTS sugar transporter subunit IIA [Kiritimatiellia bacterium]
MPHEMLTLSQAARHICIPEKLIYHLALQKEIPCLKRGGQYFFEHRELDEWAQRRIMRLSPENLEAHHKEVVATRTKNISDDRLINALLKVERINPCMQAKTKPAIIREMVKAAAATNMVNDEEALVAELTAREEVSSTAIGNGAALLHSRYFNPYAFTESFITLARTEQPLYFGSQDGGQTDIFFLICCVDDDLHLHVLARLCMLIHGTSLLQNLREAKSAEEMYAMMQEAEEALLKTL